MLTRISEFRRHRAIYCHMSRSQYSSGQYPLTWSIRSFSSSGHSHQLFHLFIIFTNLNQLSGISADLKHIRPSLNGICESFLESVCFLYVLNCVSLLFLNVHPISFTKTMFLNKQASVSPTAFFRPSPLC